MRRFFQYFSKSCFSQSKRYFSLGIQSKKFFKKTTFVPLLFSSIAVKSTTDENDELLQKKDEYLHLLKYLFSKSQEELTDEDMYNLFKLEKLLMETYKLSHREWKQLVLRAGFTLEEYTTHLMAKSIPSYLRNKKYPLVHEITPNMTPPTKAKNIGVLFFDVYDMTQEPFVKIVSQVAQETKDYFVWGYMNYRLNLDIMNIMGHQAQDAPAISAIRLGKYGYYKYTGEFTPEALKRWAEKVAKGEIELEIRSAPIPESNDGNVKIIVGKTFKKYVQEGKADVLLKYWAPWCKYCIDFEPVYEEVGKLLKNVDGIIIGKLDIDQNETFMPKMPVPAVIFFAKKYGDRGILYNGERTVEDILQFLEQHSR